MPKKPPPPRSDLLRQELNALDAAVSASKDASVAMPPPATQPLRPTRKHQSAAQESPAQANKPK